MSILKQSTFSGKSQMFFMNGSKKRLVIKIATSTRNF